MKNTGRFLTLALISSMLFLYGCKGQAVAEITNGIGETKESMAQETSLESGPDVGPAYGNEGEPGFEILDVKENYLLVCELRKKNGLYTVGHGQVRKDEKGNSIQASDLEPGMIVELDWNGIVLESYPAQFTYDSLRVTGRMGNKELTLYRKILKELAERDPGLNEGIGISYFDFTSVNTLTEEEKEGLAYMGGGYFGVWGMMATAEELKSDGILDPEKGVENGILITIEELFTEENKVSFNATKYRSGTGAYYFNNVEAVFEDGEWTYTIGSEAIS